MFYTNRQPQHNSPAMLKSIKEQKEKEGSAESLSFNLMSLTWMLYGDINKPAYFVAKITDEDDIKKNHPSLIKLYHKGGFIFYKRLPNIH